MLRASSALSRYTLIALLLLSLLTFACAKKKPARTTAAPRIGSTEKGIASWYGIPYHGRRAANGEIYDMEKLTAAHRTWRFGTWVLVENLSNGKVVNVRITDRGPFVRGRIIDLSKAAAREIDMIGTGLANVKLTVITEPANLPAVALFAVQVGAYQSKATAEQMRTKFAAQYGAAVLRLRAGQPGVWRVLVGGEPTIESANALRERIEAAGQPGLVVRLDDPE